MSSLKLKLKCPHGEVRNKIGRAVRGGVASEGNGFSSPIARVDVGRDSDGLAAPLARPGLTQLPLLSVSFWLMLFVPCLCPSDATGGWLPEPGTSLAPAFSLLLAFAALPQIAAST